MSRRLIAALVVIVVVVALFVVYLLARPGKRAEAARRVLEQHGDELMAVEGVVGVGIGECEGGPCIVVYLEGESPGLKERIPADLDGVSVRTEVTGPIQAQPK